MAFWYDYALAKGGTEQDGTLIPTTDGFAVGFRHQRLEWHGGYHAFSIQYGKGAASNFSTTITNPVPLLKDSEKLLIAEHMLFQPNDRFAIMPIFVFQRTRDGIPGHGFNDWASFAQGRKSSLPNIYLWHLKRASITPTVLVSPRRMATSNSMAGSANIQSPRKSQRGVNFSAGPRYAYS